MGVIDFLKTVGEKIGIGDESPKVEALKKGLDALGLDTKGLDVGVDGDKVHLKGDVKDHSILEKAALAVGNVVGISSVNTDGVKVAEAKAPDSIFYTVKSGDTLWKIAENHYGKGKGDKNNVIFEANRPMLTSPDKIYPGQVLRIPPLPTE